ncbi:hypothetical protein [Clostridium sp.]|uniref:hypothetical protein n=1 Tax=Clostridium sp. TaxID=1506 RepID=UPI00263831B1
MYITYLEKTPFFISSKERWSSSNNVITNNLNRIRELEEKQQDYKNLSEELETLKSTLNELTKRKI